MGKEKVAPTCGMRLAFGLGEMLRLWHHSALFSSCIFGVLDLLALWSWHGIAWSLQELHSWLRVEVGIEGCFERIKMWEKGVRGL